MNTPVPPPIVECYNLPENPSQNIIYRLLPNNPDAEYYRERTDRNIGWITAEEQEMLSGMTVGIAGCGGMGGLIASTFVRLGIGEIRIADCEEFDISNINRQFGATCSNVGVSKAFATAQKLREIIDDTTLVVYPQGINDDTVESFVRGCDIVFAEIEVFALYSYILLHQWARKFGITIFDGLVVGWGSNLFRYPPDGCRVEAMLGLSHEDPQNALDEAKIIEEQLRRKVPATQKRVVDIILNAFVPNLPSYIKNEKDRKLVLSRLQEGQASIFASVPPLATGIVAIRAVLHLIGRSNSDQADVASIPAAPSFVSIDIATMRIDCIYRAQVEHKRWST